MSGQPVKVTSANETAQLPAEQITLLPGYSQALEMIARAARVDEVKEIRDKAEAFRAYAIKARNREMEFLATEIRMRAERRAGQILIEDKRTGKLAVKEQGRPKEVSLLVTLSDLGLTWNEAAQWQRIAKLSDHEFEQRLFRIRANGKHGFLDTAFSSLSEEWLSPKEILDSVETVLGRIDLDPCAERRDAAGANVPARARYTRQDDGLSKEWSGRVFMNPPYGSMISGFVEKLITSWTEGNVEGAIALVPARTDTIWFRSLGQSAPFCAVFGRIVFKRHGGELESDTTAPFPSAIFYLGTHADRFAAEFNPKFGMIYRAAI